MTHRVLGASLLSFTLLGACRSGAQAPGETPVPDTAAAPARAADASAFRRGAVDPEASRVEILWDTWGVPHIFAEDLVAMGYAFGWAQMRSHGDLVLRLYGQARGRAAEYWGAEHLDSDRWVMTNGIPERAHEWWGVQSPVMRALLEGFIAGINDYASEHGAAITDSLEQVLPVRPVDVLAHIQRVVHFTFIANPQEITRQVQDWQSAQGSAEAPEPPAEPAPAVARGSNAWAIAPERSASGNAMLLMNPHLPWGDAFTWYEAQLVAEGVNAYGAALVGFPLPSIAFNDSLGWTHTVNTHDGADLYALRLADGGYTWDGAVREFDTRGHVIRVKQPDGRVTEQPLSVPWSLHGPVLAMNDSAALALRVVGLDHPPLIEQTWQMLGARSLDEFEAAVRRLDIPTFTVIYADRQGHILHLFNGLVPIRWGGDWRYWRGIVPSERSWTIWSHYHAYRDLPRLLDPPTGWLQNANDPPWTTTIPIALRADNYPPYMAPPPRMEFRAIRSARMLAENDPITFDEMIAFKHSTRVGAADHILEDVVHAARQYGTTPAKRAADVLELWDRQTNAESRGAILFQELMRRLAVHAGSADTPFDVDWSHVAPLSTPDGVGDPEGAARALGAAAREVEQTYGALDRPWGDVYRLQIDALDLPANGGPDHIGVFRVTHFEPMSDGRFRATSGDSFVAAVEFGTPVRARALLSYGNASQPGSPHRTDQLPLYARKQLRDVWLTRSEIEENLSLREAF
ncbi:MAG: acylase [Longimicrobiales bacterium]